MSEVQEELSSKDKETALTNVIAAIHKQFGGGSIMAFGSGSLPDVEFLSSGSISLDKALGGGYGKGRIIEVIGNPSSGKTTCALHAVAEVQKNGGQAAYLDQEHALDPIYCASLGVDMEDLLISQPDSAEEALGIAKMLAESAAVDLIVIDSVAALVPLAELSGDIGDSHMGLLARLMGQTCRALAGIAARTNTTIIFINQYRLKIGVMFGDPRTTPGGEALKYAASQRLEIATTGKEKLGEEITGVSTRVKVIKNKLAPAFRECEFSLEFGRGINKYHDLTVWASEHNVIDKSGAWYSYKGEKIGQGTSKAMEWLQANPAKYDEIFKICSEMK